MKIDVERLVSDPHRTATQLDGSTVLAGHQFISLRWLVRYRLERILTRRLAERNATCF